MSNDSMDQAYDSAMARLDAVMGALKPTATHAVLRDLQLVKDDLGRFADLATASETPPAAAPTIPGSLGDYLEDQQRAAYTIEALITGVVALAQEAQHDDIEWSLQHINGLVKQLGEGLDIVHLSRAAGEVQS